MPDKSPRIAVMTSRGFGGVAVVRNLAAAGKCVVAVVLEGPAARPTKSKPPFFKRLRDALLEFGVWGFIKQRFKKLATRLIRAVGIRLRYPLDFEWSRFLESVALRAILRSWVAPGDRLVRVSFRNFPTFEELAEVYGFEIVTVTNHNSPECVEALQRLGVELVVAAGTRILKKPVIKAAPMGILNKHSAILPFYRGLKAEFWALYYGDYEKIGITVHFIDEGLDTGPILWQERLHVLAEDDPETLRIKSQLAGARAFVCVIDRISNGNVAGKVQADKGQTYSRPNPVQYAELRRKLRIQRRAFPRHHTLVRPEVTWRA